MTNNKFEDAMKRLEEIVNTLENDQTDLDTSMKMFEEGLSLTKKLNKQLKSYEDQIDNLLKEDEEEDV